MSRQLRLLIVSLLLVSWCLTVFETTLPVCAQNASNTRLGMNVSNSYDDMFVDLIQNYPGWQNGNLTSYLGTYTANGYPTAVPAGQNNVISVATVNGYRNGIYNFYGEGDYTLSFFTTGTVQVYAAPQTPYPNIGPGNDGNYIVPGSYSQNKVNGITVTRFQINLNLGPQVGTASIGYPAEQWRYVDIKLANINPNHTAIGYPNNFHLVQDKGIDGQSSVYKGIDGIGNWTPYKNQDFTSQYLSTLGPYCSLRFLSWIQPGNPDYIFTTTPVKWTDMLPTTYWGNSHNLEHAIELCNLTGCDMWWNIPPFAESDWDLGFANLIKNGNQYTSPLNSYLHAYWECGNEMWNFSYPFGFIASWINTNLVIPKNVSGFGPAEVFMLMPHLTNIQSVLGAQGRPIFCGQQANPSICSTGLAWLAQNYGTPANYIWGIGGAPYSILSGKDAVPTNVAQVIQSLNDYLDAFLLPTIQQYSALAKQYNIHYCNYEAGQGLIPTDQSSFNLELQANLDPTMGTHTQRLVSYLKQNNVELCEIFAQYGGWDKSGFWGNAPDNSWVDSASPNYNPTSKYTTCANIAAACNCGNAPPTGSGGGGTGSGGNSQGSGSGSGSSSYLRLSRGGGSSSGSVSNQSSGQTTINSKMSDAEWRKQVGVPVHGSTGQ